MGSNDIVIRKSEFVAKTQFLNLFLILNSFVKVFLSEILSLNHVESESRLKGAMLNQSHGWREPCWIRVRVEGSHVESESGLKGAILNQSQGWREPWWIRVRVEGSHGESVRVEGSYVVSESGLKGAMLNQSQCWWEPW